MPFIRRIMKIHNWMIEILQMTTIYIKPCQEQINSKAEEKVPRISAKCQRWSSWGKKDSSIADVESIQRCFPFLRFSRYSFLVFLCCVFREKISSLLSELAMTLFFALEILIDFIWIHLKGERVHSTNGVYDTENEWRSTKMIPNEAVNLA